MSVEDTIQRGRRAKELQENPIFQEVMAHLQGETIRQWKDTASGSTTLREQLYYEVHGLGAIEAQLKSWIDDAEFEAKRLEKQNSRQA